MQGNSSAAPAGMKSIRIYVSTVIGRSVLYPYPQIQVRTNMVIIRTVVWFPVLLSRRVDEKGSRELLLLLFYTLSISLFNATIINCCPLLSRAARPLEDASLH